MRKFINLTIDEMNRNKGMYLLFILFLIVAELLSIGYGLFQIRDMIANKDLFGITEVISNNTFYAIIFAGILGLVLFTMISWIREWRMQGRFMYRLLTLPGSRLSIAWAKWASILIKGMGMIAVQTFLFILINEVLDILFTSYQNVGFKAPLAMNLSVLNMVMPINVLSFILLMLILSFVMISVSNTQIFWFSSINWSKWRAFLNTLGYALITIGLAFGPLLWIMRHFTLLDNERMWIFFVYMIVMNILHGILMSWLMKRHISV